MHGSSTVGWLLTALCAISGAVCLLRARQTRALGRNAARNEALMGFGMAATAVPGGAAQAVPPVCFAVLFVAVAGGEMLLLGALRRTRQPVAHHLHHLVGALVMIHLVLAAAGPGPSSEAHVHESAAAAGPPLLTGALLAYFTVYVVRTGFRLVPVDAGALPGTAHAGCGGPAAGTGPAGPRAPLRDLAGLPALVSACRLAMGTGMFAMLLTM